MKKINSIGYGDKIIGLAVLFLAAIPLLLFFAHSIFHLPVLVFLIKASLRIGGLITIFLIALLTVEFWQDKRINKYYEDNRNVKMLLSNGLYECQACGFRQVRNEYRSCNACGVHFKD